MATEVTKQATPTTAPPSPLSAASPEASETSLASSGMPSAPLGPAEPADCSGRTSADSYIKAAISGQLEMLQDEGAMSVRDGHGMTPLLAAVRRGSTETVLHLVKVLDADVGECDDSGRSCLHLAAERGTGRDLPGDQNEAPGEDARHHSRAAESTRSDGSVAMLTVLLDGLKDQNGLPAVDARDRQSFTPLHVASMHGDVDAARFLLRHGADVRAENEKGSTPVHWACSRGHTKIVKLLVGTYGAEFASSTRNGSTPLHWAAAKNKRRVARLLLGTYCAQVDARNDKGCTPALLAALNGHIKMVELLVDRFKAKISAHDKRQTNLLHAACEMGHGGLAAFLIERYGMSVEEPDRKGFTPLARATLRNQVEVFRRLVDEHGARLDAVTTRKSGLLHVACEGGALDTAKLLLHEYGFEADARNADGETPALIAASRGHVGVLALLVENDRASLDAADARGAGALHKACQMQGKQAAAAATVLLEAYGMPVDTADPSGTTPLHLAARVGDATLAELLTGPTGRADPGLRDGEGNQALHIAAACGHLEVVKVMAEKAGADLGARNASEHSALDVAVSKANTEVADYLRRVLPDGGKHHDRCERRSGFKRAGRWLGLGRAAGYLQNLSLENVYLLPVPTLLGLGRFPSHYDAGRKKLLVRAGDVPPYARVLFVSHPWEAPGNPDPSGRQFSALTKFLEESKQELEVGGGEGFGYVWTAFCCTSSNRIKPTFKTHLENVLTAWCFANHVLVLPESVTVRRSDGFACTDLMGYAARGWCCVELLCSAHLGVPTTLHLALGNGSWEGTPNTSLGCSVVTRVPEDDADNARINADSANSTNTNNDSTKISSSSSNNKNVSYVFQRLAMPFPATPGGQQLSLSDNDHDDDNSPATLGKKLAPSDAPDSSGFTSVGQCLSRAVESASEKLCPFFAREIEKVDPERPPMELEQSAVDFPPRSLTGELGVGIDNEAAVSRPLAKSGQIKLCEDQRSSNDARAGREGANRADMDDAADEAGEGEERQESRRGNDQRDSDHHYGKRKHHNDQDVFAVADLLWSAESETHLDRISEMVMTLLVTLDREASKLTAADAPGTPPAPDPLAMRGTLPEVWGPRGEGMGAQKEEDANCWREGTEAAQLLGRILSLGLCKQDVEENAMVQKKIGMDEEKDREEKKWGRAERSRDGIPARDGGGMPGGERRGGAGREEGGQREGGASGAANKVGVLLRDLHDNLGSFASGNERVEAMNTLLLAACYCKGVSSRTGGSSGSPKRVHRGACTRVASPPCSPPVTSPTSRGRQWSPFSPRDGPRGGARVGSPSPPPTVPLATSVPSCHIS